jgi:hypothetical protein
MNHSELLKINVNDHTEKKNGLTYLSWAWAWSEVLKVDPTANYEVDQFIHPANPSMQVPFQDIGNSCIVWVTVTIFGKPIKVQLPVLDYRNKCIVTPNAFDINTSIMRCLVKGIALHGLGLYIYAGEDLPMDAEVPQEVVSAPKAAPDTAEPAFPLEDAKLFAEGMIEYSSHVNDVKGLNSYWTSNKAQLDSLKDNHPGLYADVLSKFSALKKELSTSKE